MPAKKNTPNYFIDDDVTFYKRNSFLVGTIAAVAGGAVRDTSESTSEELFKQIIDDHEALLRLKLKEEPLCKIVALIKSATEFINEQKKQNKIFLEKSPIYFTHRLPSEHGLGYDQNYASERFAIYLEHRDFNDIWNAFKDDPSKIALLKKHYEQYVPVAAGLTLIEWLKASPDRNKPSSILLCMAALIKLDQTKLYALFRSQEYEAYASSKQGKRHSDEQLKGLMMLESKITSMAADLWRNGDQRWHSQMARDLVEALNKPVIEKIRKELSDKYPSYETDENEKKLYQKEYNKRIKYETLSINRATEILYDVAIEFKKNRGKRKNNNETDSPNNFFDNFIPPTDFSIPIDEND